MEALGRSLRRYLAGLSATAAWIPLFAAVATIAALYVVYPEESDLHRYASVGIGIGISLGIWVVLAFPAAVRATPPRATPRVYLQLVEHAKWLATRIECVARSGDACAVEEARTHLADVDARLAGVGDEMNWLSAVGYVAVWSSVHRAEEALLLASSKNELLAEVLRDQLRVRKTGLEKPLRPELDKVNDDLAAVEDETAAKGEMNRLRERFRELRTQLNAYRDARWEGLVRARNRLDFTTVITAWTAFALLLLSLALRAPRDAVASGGIFFLVGAVIGLMGQLRSDARRSEAVEDYGQAAARLRQTVLASGLAGVAGVLLTALTVQGTGLATKVSDVDLKQLFDIGAQPVQLVVAAAFGLSPKLLIDRLTAVGEDYRRELSNIETAASGDNKQPTTGEGAGEEKPQS